MNSEAAEKLECFFQSVAGSPSPLLLLDYDGTLAGFRINRFEARPWAGIRELLSVIQRDGHTRMAVITGRPAAEINPMLQLETPVEVWGLHGAERLYPDGRRELEEASPLALEKIDHLRERLRLDAFGGLFEDKPNAVVMHWRGHSPQRTKVIERKTRELFEPLAEIDGLSLLEFEAGLELRVGRDKGGAISAIIDQSEPGSPVTYLGDDLTDESAFRIINQAPAPHLSVLMRPEWRETAAEVWLRPPAELRWFLKRWVSPQKVESNRDTARELSGAVR